MLMLIVRIDSAGMHVRLEAIMVEVVGGLDVVRLYRRRRVYFVLLCRMTFVRILVEERLEGDGI